MLKPLKKNPCIKIGDYVLVVYKDERRTDEAALWNLKGKVLKITNINPNENLDNIRYWSDYIAMDSKGILTGLYATEIIISEWINLLYGN